MGRDALVLVVDIDDAAQMADALRELAAARPPRLQHDLSAWHLDAVVRETLAAYGELIDARAARG